MRRKGEQMYPQMRNWEFQDKVRQHLLATNAGQIMNTAAFEKPPPEPFPNWVSPDVADRMLPGSRMAAMSRQLGHNMEIEMLANDPMMKFKRAMEASQMMQQGPEQPQHQPRVEEMPDDEEPKAIEGPKEDPVGPSKIIPWAVFKSKVRAQPESTDKPQSKDGPAPAPSVRDLLADQQPEPTQKRDDKPVQGPKEENAPTAPLGAGRLGQGRRIGEGRTIGQSRRVDPKLCDEDKLDRINELMGPVHRNPTKEDEAYYKQSIDGDFHTSGPLEAPRYFWNIPGKIIDRVKGKKRA
jgi:hypothetical protein